MSLAPSYSVLVLSRSIITGTDRGQGGIFFFVKGVMNKKWKTINGQHIYIIHPWFHFLTGFQRRYHTFVLYFLRGFGQFHFSMEIGLW